MTPGGNFPKIHIYNFTFDFPKCLFFTLFYLYVVSSWMISEWFTISFQSEFIKLALSRWDYGRGILTNGLTLRCLFSRLVAKEILLLLKLIYLINFQTLLFLIFNCNRSTFPKIICICLNCTFQMLTNFQLFRQATQTSTLQTWMVRWVRLNYFNSSELCEWIKASEKLNSCKRQHFSRATWMLTTLCVWANSLRCTRRLLRLQFLDPTPPNPCSRDTRWFEVVALRLKVVALRSKVWHQPNNELRHCRRAKPTMSNRWS